MSGPFSYNFEWTPAKARQNIVKHGVSFEQATAVFHDPLMITMADEDHSDDEDRWLSLGRSGTFGLLVVIHTYEEGGSTTARIRIISARRATKSEQMTYEEGQ